MSPENRKYYQSRDVRFIEKLVYGDIYGKNSIKDWDTLNVNIDRGNWLINCNENDIESISEREKEKSKRKGRGRPRKNKNLNTNEIQKINYVQVPVTDIGFSVIPADVEPIQILKSDRLNRDAMTDEVNTLNDEVMFVLLANINKDPTSYKDAMNSDEKSQWCEAVSDELSAMEKNKAWKIVDRPTRQVNEQKPNTIDSRWVLKRKFDTDGKIKHKARLVIRSFKDRNAYDLQEMYAPVSRLSLARCVLAIANKFDLNTCQLDVKTAFLNRTVKEEIFMEIPEGTSYSDEVKHAKVCQLRKALYGLRLSPKRWNERFTEAATKIGLKSHPMEPCLFTWRAQEKFLILVLYVDDMLIASNDSEKLRDVKLSLQREFEMTDLGEVKNFLGINISRNREKKTIKLTQEAYTHKILERFGFESSKPQRTPMVTNQILNLQRKM